MKRLLLVALLFAAAIMYTGCGSSSLPKTDEGDIPDWFLNTPEDPNYLFSPATATSKDMQLAVDKASTDGRAEIGRQVETRIQALQKKFDEEVGVGEDAQLLQQFTQATKTVVSTSLSGSKISKKEIVKDGENWRAYVLVQYPLGAANEALLNQIKKNEQMYTRFRSSQTFEELDKEVEKYEEFKKKEGQQ